MTSSNGLIHAKLPTELEASFKLTHNEAKTAIILESTNSVQTFERLGFRFDLSEKNGKTICKLSLLCLFKKANIGITEINYGKKLTDFFLGDNKLQNLKISFITPVLRHLAEMAEKIEIKDVFAPALLQQNKCNP